MDHQITDMYRLQSRRRKVRMQYRDFEKQLKKIDKEKNRLWLLEHSLGWEPLVEPYIKGWERSFVLRMDIANGTQSDFYKSLLGKINTIEYCSRKDFTKKGRSGGMKIRKPIHQRLKYLDEVDRMKISFSEQELKCFEPIEFWNERSGKWDIRYAVKETWRYELKVSPHMVTHRRIHDAELASQRRQLDTRIERECLRPLLIKMKHGHNRWRWNRTERTKLIIKSFDITWQKK